MKVSAILVVIAAAAIGACGVVGTATPTPGVADQLHLTQADAGRQIAVRSGTTIELQMEDQYSVPGSSTQWTAVSTDTRVLRLTQSSRQSPQAIAGARATYVVDFVARSPGKAEITILGRNTCEAMNPAYCNGTSLPSITVVVG